MRMVWGIRSVGNRGTLRVKVYPGPASVLRGLLRVAAKVCSCFRGSGNETVKVRRQ